MDPWAIEEELKKRKRQEERPQIQLPIPEAPLKPPVETPQIIVIQL